MFITYAGYFIAGRLSDGVLKESNTVSAKRNMYAIYAVAYKRHRVFTVYT